MATRTYPDAQLPESQWETFGWTHHPDRPPHHGHGVLVRNRTTGHYALALGGSLSSVRQGWARKEAERLTVAGA